jgi:hypothetical protein
MSIFNHLTLFCLISVLAYADDIADIRKHYNYINKNMGQFTKIECSDIANSLEKTESINEASDIFWLGAIDMIVYEYEKYKKIVVSISARYTNVISEYYYYKNMLFFLFSQRIEDNKTKYENRYYFENNKLIKWLDVNKNIVERVQEPFSLYDLVETRTIEDSQIYLSLCTPFSED